MRILGIDPGLAIVGYSVIDIVKDKNILVSSGSIQTDKNKTDAERLLEIETDLQTIIEKFKPDFASIEKLVRTDGFLKFCSTRKTKDY